MRSKDKSLLESDAGNNLKVSLDNNNFILRGCSLQNTEEIIGAVAFSGYLFEKISILHLL